jgi:hypothetical protein
MEGVAGLFIVLDRFLHQVAVQLIHDPISSSPQADEAFILEYGRASGTLPANKNIALE